ncbi:MAG: hypothetical protein U0353_07370 [Sandaracinus sp.]
MSPKDSPIVEWYRLDASRRILGTLVLGSSIMLLGSIVSAMGLVRSRGSLPHPFLGHRGAVLAAEAATERSPMLELTTGLVALGCLLGGGATAIIGLKRALSEESYLALRHDGALFVHGDTERFVAWDDLEDVRWDARSDALLFVGHDGVPVPLEARFADVTNQELARRVLAVRRRAVHGLLRTSRPTESSPA